MAIVKMSKMKLTGLSYEKEKLLNALHKTQLVELKCTEDDSVKPDAADENLKNEVAEKLVRTERSIAFITEQLDRAKKQDYYPKENSGLSDDILISYDDFMSTSGNEVELFYVIEKMEEYSRRLTDARSRRVKLNNMISQLEPYLYVDDKLSDFKDTANTKCALGTIGDTALEQLKNFIEGEPLADLTVFSRERQCTILIVAHNECAEAVFKKANELSFAKCTFNFDRTAREEVVALNKELVRCKSIEKDVNKKVCGKSGNLRNLKILADFYAFQLEKLNASEKFGRTASTFTLSGYLPEEEISRVKNAVYDATEAVVMEFSVPAEDETPPTLLKNKGPAKAAEFVTNMYSAPDYREFDPNGIVFIFFMIFFGLIMADVGYGVLLLVGGLVLLKRLKIDNGFKKLVYIITYGGAFTILFGLLFGSVFGFSMYKFLPDPTLSGEEGRINVLIILLGCLALGLFQITVGYILKAVNCFRQKQFADGIFDGLTWVLFNVGLFFAVFNFLTQYFGITVAPGVKNFFDVMALPGIIMLGIGLFVAMVTAGRKEKLLGKFTKGFGAVYGIINLLSDVLSYARLFGLMLSGMIIAQQFNGIGLDIIAVGGLGYIFGPLVMLIGHSFNIAMGVLGAYVHDCRLQYIEFFSKFYAGEGELFTPLGSQFKFIHLTK